MSSNPVPTQPAVDDQTAYLLKKLETADRALEIAVRKSRTAHREGWREGQAEMADVATRWRRAYESAHALLAQTTTVAVEEQVEKLDEAVRSWVGRA